MSPTILANLIQQLEQAFKMLSELRQIASTSVEQYHLLQQQAELWRDAKRLTADPEGMLADSAELWRSQFDGLDRLSESADALGLHEPKRLNQQWRVALGALRDEADDRLRELSGEALATVDHAHTQLTDLHTAAFNRLESEHRAASKLLHEFGQAVKSTESGLGTYLPILTKSQLRLTSQFNWLAASIARTQYHVEQGFVSMKAGVAYGQEVERRWHHDINEHLGEFHADPFAAMARKLPAAARKLQ